MHQTVLSNFIVGDRLKIGALGESECQDGYQPIKSLSRCNEQRKEMSIAEWNHELHKNKNGRLPYCWIGPGGRANYNPNGDAGPTAQGARLLCESRKSCYSF